MRIVSAARVPGDGVAQWPAQRRADAGVDIAESTHDGEGRLAAENRHSRGIGESFRDGVGTRTETGDNGARCAPAGDEILSCAGVLLRMDVDRRVCPSGDAWNCDEAAKRPRKPKAEAAYISEGDRKSTRLNPVT